MRVQEHERSSGLEMAQLGPGGGARKIRIPALARHLRRLAQPEMSGRDGLERSTPEENRCHLHRPVGVLGAHALEGPVAKMPAEVRGLWTGAAFLDAEQVGVERTNPRDRQRLPPV